MNLEKAISQTKAFKTSQEKAMVNTIYTYIWLRDKQKQFFKQFDITMQQFNILRILRGAKEPISTAVIRERMLDRASDASRMVDRMEKKNLVIKETCESDQRKIDVSISKKGLALLNRIDDKMLDWQKMTMNLNKKEAEQLSQLLDKMRS